MYIGDPAASVSRPVKELKAFQRITLQPGETRRVEFAVTKRDLAFWLNTGRVAEPGDFKVWIGPDSATGPEGKFSLSAARSSS
jgi:beta-glucosidase